MGYLQKKWTLDYWQFGVFKLSLISFGIILGIYFADFWRALLWLVWIVFVVCSLAVLVMYFSSHKG